MGWRCLAASNFAQPRGASRSIPVGSRSIAQRPELVGCCPTTWASARSFSRIPAGWSPPTSDPPTGSVEDPASRSPPPGMLPGEPWDRVREAASTSPPGRDGLPEGHTCPERTPALPKDIGTMWPAAPGGTGPGRCAVRRRCPGPRTKSRWVYGSVPEAKRRGLRCRMLRDPRLDGNRRSGQAREAADPLQPPG